MASLNLLLEERAETSQFRCKAGLFAQGGMQGRIRSWVAWDDIGVLLYNIRDNRWCGNIGRAHKSNGIFIIADLQEGTVVCI